MKKVCAICRNPKDESEILLIAAGEVDPSQSHDSHIQFKNIKELPICKICWISNAWVTP
jgi:hypothetical protein